MTLAAEVKELKKIKPYVTEERVLGLAEEYGISWEEVIEQTYENNFYPEDYTGWED